MRTLNQRAGNAAASAPAWRCEYALLPPRPADHGALAARRLHAHRRPTARRPISNTMSSRCRWTSSASRCTPSRPSPPASATCARPAAARCALGAPTRRRRRRSSPNYLATDEDRRVAADCDPAHPPHRRGAGAGAATSRRSTGPAPQAQTRGRAGARRRRHRHHDLPSGRHLPQMGAGQRPDGGGRRAAARARPRGPAGGRRLDHADDHLGQHQRAHHDDRREGGRSILADAKR